jgi:TolB-like protein
MDALFEELKRRRVFRAAGTYAMASWVIVQIASTIAPVLRLPEWALSIVVYLLVLFFPVALLLSWLFDMRAEGLVAATEQAPATPRRLTVAMLTGLALLSSFLLFALLRSTGGGLAAADVVPPPAGERSGSLSIAVLPFHDLSPDDEQRWFADGLAEDVVNGLAASNRLQLAPRSATLRFGAAADPKQVGVELGVATVLQGSVRRIGKQVRINVQLVDSRSGFQVWSRAYDGRLDDILSVQTDTAAAIVADLNVQFGIDVARRDRALDQAEGG